MHSTTIPLFLVAAGVAGFLHSILPDHWVPRAVVARTKQWSLVRTVLVSFLASIGHVVTSIVIGAQRSGLPARSPHCDVVTQKALVLSALSETSVACTISSDLSRGVFSETHAPVY